MVRAKSTDGRKGEVTLRKLTVSACILAFAACASPGTPPGGPVDTAAPLLVRLSPDSGRTRVKPPAAIFHFDEVVSERPPGTTSLNQLFLISPRDGTPNVDWHRKDITVKPNKGWRSNTTYVVTMLPGIADLRGNVSNKSGQIVFSTGAAQHAGSIRGNVWNWVAGSSAAQGYVEAVSLADSIVYVAVADSSGVFRMNYLPPGRFLVRAVIDENKNRGVDPREAWDSASVVLTDSSTVALFVIARDSIAPTIGTVTLDDSVTLRVTFERALDPASHPSVAEVVVQASDSSRITVTNVSLPAADTTAVPRKSPRAPPPQIFLVKVATSLKPGADYRMAISRVTGIAKISAPAVKTFRTPAVIAPPAAKVK